MLNTTSFCSRRRFLELITASILWPTTVHGLANPNPLHLVALWRYENAFFAGIIEVTQTSWSIQKQIALPSRGHGVEILPDGTILLCARRPGDWFVLWDPKNDQMRWHWLESDRFLNGHILWHSALEQVLTSQTDRETGDGLLVTYSRTFEEIGSYPTFGHDPHEMLIIPEDWQHYPKDSIVIANGGIPTFPEYGRQKKLSSHPMDASLLVYSPSLNATLHQSELEDPYLSIRHLAWNTVSKTVGVALQAEHPDLVQRRKSPIFAEWDGSFISTEKKSSSFHGYGGSICSLPQQPSFLVSSPPSASLFSMDSNSNYHSLPQVCPIASDTKEWVVGGKDYILRNQNFLRNPTIASKSFEWDNHWALYFPSN